MFNINDMYNNLTANSKSLLSDEFIDMVDDKAKSEEESEQIKEYEEITNNVKLVIHNIIDKISDESLETLDQTITDINHRIDLECSGHGLDRNKFNKIISILTNALADIYADEDNKPSSTLDLFKYAVTQYFKEKLGE